MHKKALKQECWHDKCSVKRAKRYKLQTAPQRRSFEVGQARVQARLKTWLRDDAPFLTAYNAGQRGVWIAKIRIVPWGGVNAQGKDQQRQWQRIGYEFLSIGIKIFIDKKEMGYGIHNAFTMHYVRNTGTIVV